MEITLNKVEFWNAINVGIIRQMQNISKGRIDAYGAQEMDGWGIHIEGACGEAAIAKLFNIYYNGNIGNLNAVDVNHNKIKLEVRTTQSHTNRLIMHDKDKDDAYYILLTGKAPTFVVRGYIKGIDGKNEKFWDNPTKYRPAYFIAQSQLLPIENLLKSDPSSLLNPND